MTWPETLMRFWILPMVFTVWALLSASGAKGQNRAIDFKLLQDSISLQPKPVLLLLSTDWCVYCRMQKFQIRRNKNFKKNSSHFYYAELNAESKEPLQFKGRTYHFLPNGTTSGVHELAVVLGKHNGTLSYPIWVVMDKNLQILYRHSGVLNRKDLVLLTESLINLKD